MAKRKTVYVCQECGYESLRWMGKCTNCNNWNSFQEEVKQRQKKSLGAGQSTGSKMSKPTKMKQIEYEKEERLTTDMKEFNRVLGGGIVPGSLVLIGGDPGIGKSTLLIQTSAEIAEKEKTVLYISGEESMQQMKLRANRLGIDADQLYVIAETNLYDIMQHIKELNPEYVVVDSIQTMFKEEVTSAAGSVTQVRECTMELMKTAKTKGIPIFIVSHVTKEGAIAGPRMLEHMV